MSNEQAPLTEQQVLDVVYNHFVVNKGPASVMASGNCAYRGPNGCKCAVGLFIPDDRYTTQFEGNRVGALLGEYPELCDVLVHKNLLARLQTVHDNEATQGDDLTFNARMELGLRAAAQDFGLTVPS